MSAKCNCGSRLFKPLGIQESWPGRPGRTPRLLFLVNCAECGTTLTVSSLDYALLRSEEAVRTLDLSFFTAGEQSAA
jgi:hypothetical protein